MENESYMKDKVIIATKWSVITELSAKLVSPLTNMALARIISPEAFGVIATITMITSFADMFTDAGFQKYLVQKEFKNEKVKLKNTNVAFLTNLFISLLLVFLIILFREGIAKLVGNPGLGSVIAISSFQLLFTAFSSIQMSLYKRDFNFKTLFLVRIITILVPIIVTIPLALLGLSYWALVIGMIFTQFLNALILTIKSMWKPNLFFSFEILREMFSFSIWSLIEEISIWLTTWIDTFIIGSYLSDYYIGIYKTSTTLVNTFMSLITASIIPVLFSTLSRLQNNTKSFNWVYFNVQKIVSIFVFPLGVGIFIYSHLVTKILLGSQWVNASKVIGIWALTSSIMIVLGYFCSEVYRAKGRPKLSFLAQMLHLIVLIPTCLISVKYGFWVLVYARSWIRLQFIFVHLIFMKTAMRIQISKTLANVFPAFISAVSMGILGYILKHIGANLIWQLFSIAICIIFYFFVLYLFPGTRLQINILKEKLKNRLIPAKVE